MIYGDFMQLATALLVPLSMGKFSFADIIIMIDIILVFLTINKCDESNVFNLSNMYLFIDFMSAYN